MKRYVHVIVVVIFAVGLVSSAFAAGKRQSHQDRPGVCEQSSPSSVETTPPEFNYCLGQNLFSAAPGATESDLFIGSAGYWRLVGHVSNSAGIDFDGGLHNSVDPQGILNFDGTLQETLRFSKSSNVAGNPLVTADLLDLGKTGLNRGSMEVKWSTKGAVFVEQGIQLCQDCFNSPTTFIYECRKLIIQDPALGIIGSHLAGIWLNSAERLICAVRVHIEGPLSSSEDSTANDTVIFYDLFSAQSSLR
ncbi:MAG: hypothetical protein ACXWP5_01880 [Bdellovibrionota bacterium]